MLESNVIQKASHQAGNNKCNVMIPKRNELGVIRASFFLEF